MAGRNYLTGQRWKNIRSAAFRRDAAKQAPCWICGQPINYSADAGTPDAWEPDHYLTLDTHPEYAYDITNLRPSHSSCNRRRGAKDVARKRWDAECGNQSRDWGV